MPAVERENLRAFLAVLDDSDDNGRIMKAEVLRELGDFAGALAVLDWEFGADYVHGARQIGALARAGIASVREIEPA